MRALFGRSIQPRTATPEDAAAAQCVADGVRLVARESTAIFAAVDSWEELASVAPGEALVAAGPAGTSAEGYLMAPVRPRGAVDVCSFEVSGAGGFSTRPSASLGESTAEDSALVQDSASELKRLRDIRMQAYRQKHGGPCRRRSGRGACVCAVLTTPVVFVVWILRRIFSVVLAGLAAILGSLLQPYFWCGVCAALALLVCLARSHCVEPARALIPQGPGRPQPVQFLCETDHPWAQELRHLVLSVSESAAILVLESRVWLAQFLDTAASFRDAVLWPLFGWCPYRSAEDALQRCAQQVELQRVREAPDCTSLRRAFHEGQRLFHPDHFRLRHPACSEKVLESCSVALNGAMEQRRGALKCPAR